MLRKMGLIGVIGLAVVAFAACDDNPLAENRDDVVRFDLNPSYANVQVAGFTKVTAIPVNIHGERTGDPVTGTACDAKITVVPDQSRTEFEPPERFIISGKSAGESCLTVTAGGVSATVTINVVP